MYFNTLVLLNTSYIRFAHLDNELTRIHCSSLFCPALQLLDDDGTAFSGSRPADEELAVSAKGLLLDSQPVRPTTAQPDKRNTHIVNVTSPA